MLLLFFAYRFQLNDKLSLNEIYVFSVVSAVITAVYDPAMSTMVPSIVDKKDLIDAISYLLAAVGEIFISVEQEIKGGKLSIHKFFKDFGEGIVLIKKTKILFNVMAIGLFLNFVLTPVRVNYLRVCFLQI
jgi:hypothetical protein